MITQDDVKEAQRAWADGIVEIGRVFIDKGDYTARATQHINTLYAYDHGGVLFKPTLASSHQFRTTFDEALSYFVGGDIAEDNGFAIRPWSKVRFGEQEILIIPGFAVAMGNYYMTQLGSDEEIKVEFTLGYIKDADGNLRIRVHHSSFPYTP